MQTTRTGKRKIKLGREITLKSQARDWARLRAFYRRQLEQLKFIR